ncbi:MAG TPA: EamA family transporter [Chryseolinea sp.]|nr:EamA family transporter [Chryseolinea sp.]
MNNARHYFAGIAAFIIWGFFALPLRAISDYSTGAILYFRIFFSCVVLLVIIFGFKRADLKKDLAVLRSLSPSDRKTTILLTMAGGALLIVNWLTFIYIVNNINIKTASFAYMICPVITALLGYFMLKEKLTSLQWTAVALCAISCILMGLNSSLELGYSFLTAFTYALYLVSQRRNQGFDRMIMLGVQVLFSFVILNFFFSALVKELPVSGRFYSVTFLIAVLFTVLPLFLNLFALNKINSATIGILLYLNPIFNFSIAFIVFKEKINTIQIISYSIIVIALILFNYPVFKKVRGAMVEKFT